MSDYGSKTNWGLTDNRKNNSGTISVSSLFGISAKQVKLQSFVPFSNNLDTLPTDASSCSTACSFELVATPWRLTSNAERTRNLTERETQVPQSLNTDDKIRAVDGGKTENRNLCAAARILLKISTFPEHWRFRTYLTPLSLRRTKAKVALHSVCFKSEWSSSLGNKTSTLRCVHKKRWSCPYMESKMSKA